MSALLRAVDPAARVVLQQVEHVLELHVGELALERGADTLQPRRARISRRSAQRERRIARRHARRRATPRRRGTGTAAGRRRGTRPRRAGTRTRCARGCAAVSAAGASLPTSTVTISLSSSTSGRAACTPRRQASPTAATMPRRASSAIQSPSVIGPHVGDRVAHGLRDLAGAHPRRRASVIAVIVRVELGVGVVVDERGERLGDAGGRRRPRRASR